MLIAVPDPEVDIFYLGGQPGTVAQTRCRYRAIIASDPCSYCGGRFQQAEHIEPLRHGGEDAWFNLTSSCRACNSAKSARPLLEFLHIAAFHAHDAAVMASRPTISVPAEFDATLQRLRHRRKFRTAYLVRRAIQAAVDEIEAQWRL